MVTFGHQQCNAFKINIDFFTTGKIKIHRAGKYSYFINLHLSPKPGLVINATSQLAPMMFMKQHGIFYVFM